MAPASCWSPGWESGSHASSRVVPWPSRVRTRRGLADGRNGCWHRSFPERAGRDLLATGEKVRKRSAETRNKLTPQEQQIARLAREGLSNQEIGARLYISPRTVEWHLHKVFAKLGVTSRKGLDSALPKRDRHTLLA